MPENKKALILTLLLGACLSRPPAQAQQVADPDFKPQIKRPAYAEGRGPAVCIDEAHENFHTAGGRYAPFADFVRRDGYVVKPQTSKFSEESLGGCSVLVIANARGKLDPSQGPKLMGPAFNDEEVRAVAAWVNGGGSLFLIVDHMPMPGANQKLADAFGVRFSFAMIPDVQTPMVFKRADGLLADHPVTNGRDNVERIDAVATFTGSAFRVDKGGEPILIFGQEVISLEPEAPWQFKPETPRVPVKGWLQGATLHHGEGRVAVFGEAAMFTAQVAGPNKIKAGMNALEAKENAQFLLNVMHWLTGLLR